MYIKIWPLFIMVLKLIISVTNIFSLCDDKLHVELDLGNGLAMPLSS